MQGDTERRRGAKKGGREGVCALEMSQPAALLLSSLAATIMAFVSDTTSIDGTRLVQPQCHLLIPLYGNLYLRRAYARSPFPSSPSSPHSLIFFPSIKKDVGL